MEKEENKCIAVIGGGLVGGTVACLLAKKGFRIDLYESRPDIRKAAVVRGRSINLALSIRGRAALAAIGIEDQVMSSAMPMRARMIHDVDGRKRSISYGKEDQYIASIDRRKLNEDLLNACDSESNVKIFFEHKLNSCDFNSGEMTFKTTNGIMVQRTADLILGCDGAFSTVRQQLAKSTRLNFSQEYIPHGYMELNIPALPNGKFAMEPGFLHIWPRNEFMMIGLPNNEDKSFVSTLFMPYSIFEGLNQEQDIIAFFQKTFPDAITLIGQDRLVKTVMASKALSLVMVKCNPYHYADKALIMGDAAHAMVPFYGQGMNCGLEDVLVFSNLIDKYDNDFSKALPAFTAARNEDCIAICDLAMYNYEEMRKSVNSPLFLIRKKVDNFLHNLMPQAWIPLYTMVSFSRKRYSDCIKEKHWQDKVLYRLTSVAATASLACCSLYVWKINDQYLVSKMVTFCATIGEWLKNMQFGEEVIKPL